MSRAITKNRLTEIAETVNAEHAKIVGVMREGLTRAVTVGELLTEAKQLVNHGQWGAWIADNCQFSERTAQNYMRIADRMPQLDKSATVADLTYREAIGLLADPKPEPEAKPSAGGDWIDRLTWANQEGKELLKLKGQIDQDETNQDNKSLTPARRMLAVAQALARMEEFEQRAAQHEHTMQAAMLDASKDEVFQALPPKLKQKVNDWLFDYKPHKLNAILPWDESVIEQLADDMRRNGWLEFSSITLFEGAILDGKLRLEAAKRANITPLFEIFNGDTEAALKRVISKNLTRQQLTESQRAGILLKAGVI